VPHALAWILELLSQEDAVTHYGRRLVTLRAHAPQPWRDALQEAIEAQRIDESLELAEGWQAIRESRPARSHPGPWCVHDSSNIVFSRDGRLMVVTSTFGQAAVWNTADWKVTRFLSYQQRYPYFDLSPGGDALRVVFHDCITTFPLIGEQPERITRLPQVPEMYPSRITEDGRLLIGCRSREDVLDVWDTASGKLVRSITVPQYRDEYALAARTGLVAHHSPQGFVVEPLSASGKEKPLVSGDGEAASLAFSPDGRTLLTTSDPKVGKTVQLWNIADGKCLATAVWPYGCATVKFSASGKMVALVGTGQIRGVAMADLQPPGIESKQQTDELAVYRLPDLRPIGNRSFAKPEDSYGGETSAAISPDGQWLSVAVKRRGLWIYALPAMTEVKSCPIADPLYHADDAPGVAFSPDGKWLVAAAVDRPGPRWFRTPDWAEVEPYVGHTGQVVGLHFLDGGKTLLSWAADGSVCRWDAETMAMQSRIRVPSGYLPLHLHGRAGRLLLCARATDPPNQVGFRRRPANEDDQPTEAAPRQVQRLFDPEKQQFVGDLHVPATGEVVWLNDDEYLWNMEKEWRRVRAGDGRTLDRRKIAAERESLAGGPAQFGASEDSTQLWSLSGLRGDPRGLRQLTLRIFDAATLELRKEVAIDRRYWSNEPFTLVPGGKFFSIGPQIFDRQTCRFLHDRRYPDVHFTQMAFSPDGSRYAAASYGSMYVDGGPPGWDADDYGFIHVHDTASGRLIAMIPSSSRWGRVAPLCFSDDGGRLAFSGIEGVIAVWNLPP
jgi:WD40 repeat protein